MNTTETINQLVAELAALDAPHKSAYDTYQAESKRIEELKAQLDESVLPLRKAWFDLYTRREQLKAAIDALKSFDSL